MSKQSGTPAPVFPTYLTPTFNFPVSFSFRKRQPSNASSSSLFSKTNEATSASSTPSSSAAKSRPASPTSNQSLRSLPSLTPISSISTNLTSQHPSPPSKTPLTTPHPPILRCRTCTTHLAYTSQIISRGFTGRHGRAYLISPPPPVPISTIMPFPPKRKIGKDLVNVRVGKSMRRELASGQHTVADIECVVCGGVVGWKYVDAREAGQRYKIGNFILEGERCVEDRGWEWGIGASEAEADEELTCRGDDNGEGEERGNNFNFYTLNTNKSESSGINGRFGRSQHQKLETNMSRGVPKGFNDGSELRELEIEMGRRRPGDEGQGDMDDVVVFDEEDEDECDELFAGVWDAEIVRRRRWRRTNGRGGLSLWRRREMGNEEGWVG